LGTRQLIAMLQDRDLAPEIYLLAATSNVAGLYEAAQFDPTTVDVDAAAQLLDSLVEDAG